MNYSFLDRLLHRLAFSGPTQLVAAEIERLIFGRPSAPVAAANPIFVSSLPRAGTTALLEAFSRVPSVATHRYRDMPFVLAPMLWARLSGPFQRRPAPRERAHGDGVWISEDSPEGFEEVFWRTFWPQKYQADGVGLWTASDRCVQAEAFFADHMQRVIALRRPERPADARYVSKNNANIARLGLIPTMYPGARIVVPVRAPLEQAASLWRQHRHFLATHAREPFARRYMSDIGHYEFGQLHRPIRFPGFASHVRHGSPLTVDYWLKYWIAAFEHVLDQRDRVILVSHDALCANPREQMRRLLAAVELDAEGADAAVAAVFRSPPATTGLTEPISPGLRERAEAIHRALQPSD
jgi:hypothetical protein